MPVRRLDGHGGVVVDALRQPAHDLAQCGLRHDAELGGYVEQLALSGGRTGLQPLLLEAVRDAGQDRTVDPGQQQHPVGERPIGRELAEVETAQLRGGRRVVLEPRGVAQPVVRRLECGLPEAVERLALAEEGAAGQARVPADEGGERPGRPRGGGRLCRSQGGAEPHADRGHGGRAEVEEVLAGRLDAGLPGRHPVGVVLQPGGVTRAVVVEAERDDARLGQLLGQPPEGAVRGAPLLPHRRAEDRAAAGHATGRAGHPAVERTRLRPEPHLGVLGPVDVRTSPHGSGQRYNASADRTPSGQSSTSVPCVANRARVIRSSPKPMQALCAGVPSARCRSKEWPKWSSW